MSNKTRKIKDNILKKGLLQYPEPFLRFKAGFWVKPVPEVNDKLVRTLQLERGLAVAAPQIGVLERLFYWYIPSELEEGFIVNPEYVDMSEEKVEMTEGCLSMRRFYWNISRPEYVRIKYQDINGDDHEQTFSGLAARVIQHEMDHFDGTLIVDYLDDEQYDNFEKFYFGNYKSDFYGGLVSV